MKFKIGDRVKVYGLAYVNEAAPGDGFTVFNREVSEFYGCEATVVCVGNTITEGRPTRKYSGFNYVCLVTDGRPYVPGDFRNILEPISKHIIVNERQCTKFRSERLR